MEDKRTRAATPEMGNRSNETRRDKGQTGCDNDLTQTLPLSGTEAEDASLIIQCGKGAAWHGCHWPMLIKTVPK